MPVGLTASAAEGSGEAKPGKACNSCERALHLPFLTLQRPKRQRFMTAGSQENEEERVGGLRHQRESWRKNEINIQRSADDGAEMR